MKLTLEGTWTVAIAVVTAASAYLSIQDAEAGPYVQAGVYYHDADYTDLGVPGDTDFPFVLELSAGYKWDNGWFVQAVHYSNPQAHDYGFTAGGVGYRYEW